jgi:hypothetical protein
MLWGAFSYLCDLPDDAGMINVDVALFYDIECHVWSWSVHLPQIVFWPFISGVFRCPKRYMTTGLTHVYSGTVAWGLQYFNVFK